MIIGAIILALAVDVANVRSAGMFASNRNRVILRAASRLTAKGKEFLHPALHNHGIPRFATLEERRDASSGALARRRRSDLRTALVCCATRGVAADATAVRGWQGEHRSRRLGLEIARVLRCRGMRLVLHFDLNKTLIMVDPAGGKTQSQVLNSVLSEICWGHVERGNGEEQAATWNWDGRPPSTEPPRRNASGGPQQVREGKPSELAVSYSDFLHEEFGDAEGKDNRKMKEARDQRKGSFTEDGHPGAGLRGEYLRLERAVSLPEAVARSPLAEGAGLAGRGSYFVLPSFFQCLLALKEAEADFGVVFRTFGDDIAGVSKEYNAFCEGNHPLFPGVRMDGSDGRGDYRVHLGQGGNGLNTVGSFFRDEKGIALILGTLGNPRTRQQLRSIEREGNAAVYRSIDDTHRAICQRVVNTSPPPRPPPEATEPPATPAAPASAPTLPPEDDGGIGESGRREANGRCLALRDFYPFWRENLEDAATGKILPVDLSENPKVWPIMFDDNIGRPGDDCGAHIVDVRDVSTGAAVPFHTALKRHIVRAEPFLAIGQGGFGGPSTAVVAAADDDVDDDAAPAAACGYNFFLIEAFRRLAPEMANSFDGANSNVGCSPTAVEP